MALEDVLRVCAERVVSAHDFPGCVVGVTHAGKRTVLPVGTLRYDENSSVAEDTVYDLASVTKSIVTATLVLLFEYDSKLKRTDRVAQYLPTLHNDYAATIEDLLTYRVKGVKMSTLAHLNSGEIITRVLETGFDGPPGERAYTNLPAFLLGLILEQVGGNFLPQLSDRYVCTQLGMRDTTFFPDENRCAPTEIVAGKEICGVVHDESARAFEDGERTAGHAGLFSTAGDLLTYLEALLDLNDVRMQVVREGAELGLGFERDREWMGQKRNAKTFGKTGFTGTSILCDVERQTGIVILSNRTYPNRPPSGEAINRFRAAIADLVWGSIDG